MQKNQKSTIENLEVLKKSGLFKGTNTSEIENFLDCLNAKIKQYQKGERIFKAGIPITKAAIVLQGRIHIMKNDYWGNKTILTDIAPGQIFGETLAIMKDVDSGVDAQAMCDSEVMFIDIQKLLENNGETNNIIIKNLLTILAKRNYMLTKKIEQVTRRSTRNKLMAFLSDQANENKSSTFNIPYNRQQLADYLSVDRSAMSNELCKMRDEGIIEFYKNSFRIK